MKDADSPFIETPPEGVDELFGSFTELMRRFVQLLGAEGVERGLIGPRETQRIWSRHILNCAVLCDLIPKGAKVADIGSGAGLPGIVLAIARPDLSVSLIESMTRRCEWLRFVTAEFGLSNVTVINDRAENVQPKQAFSVVTARAVGNLMKLIPWSSPLLLRGGQAFFLKGESVADEVLAAKNKGVLRKQRLQLVKVLELATPLTGEVTRVVHLRKF